MSWGKLRLRTASHGVVFEGEASPAPGGGAMPGAAIITPVTILYSDMVDTGNGYRFAPIVDLAADDVLLWVYAFVSVAFNDSNAGVGGPQIVDSGNSLEWGIAQQGNFDVPVDESSGYLNIGFYDNTPPSAPAAQTGQILILTPVTIGVTDNGSLAGDGTAGTMVAYYAKASP